MKWFKRLSTAVVIATLCVGCSTARKNYSAGQEFEEQGRYEEAMFRYAEAFKADPESSEYRLRFLNARLKAAAEREKNGDGMMAAGRYGEAVAEYQAAAGLDGSLGRYLQKVSDATSKRDASAAWQEGQNLEKANKLRDAALAYQRALDLVPENKQYQAAVNRIAALRKQRLDGFELQLKSTQPLTLRFRETRLKEIFAVISRLSGINFIFDDDVKDQNVTVNLEKGTFRQATDLLTGMYKLSRKVLNETTMLIYPRTSEKIKQHETMVVRTFHLNYLDAKKAAALVRALVQVRRLHVNEDGNSLVLRDTADVALVVEKILEANDLPEAEVVLDVEVVEINNKNTHDLGLLLSSYSVQLGGFTPDNKLLSSTLLAGGDNKSAQVDTAQLLKAFSINRFGGYVTVPYATYNFGKTLAQGEVLSNPKIRVKHKEKARFTVGQRVPVQTTSSTGTITSSNVQYVDVGIKLNAESTILTSNEVSVKLGLEVSSVINRETNKTDNTTLLTLGTRNLDTVLSLKDGETVVIGGLIYYSDSDSKVKIFLLGDIPLLGPLLSNNKQEKEKSELLLAITPRLVRGVSVPSRALSSFDSGREDEPSAAPPYQSFEQDPEYSLPGQKHPAVPGQPGQPVVIIPSPSVTGPVSGPPRQLAPPLTAPQPAQPPQTSPVPGQPSPEQTQVTPPVSSPASAQPPPANVPSAPPPFTPVQTAPAHDVQQPPPPQQAPQPSAQPPDRPADGPYRGP